MLATFTGMTAVGWFYFQLLSTPTRADSVMADEIGIPVGLSVTDVPQYPPAPIVIDQTATTDNLAILMAAGSEHDSQLVLCRPGPEAYPKHYGFINWSRRSDYLRWQVAVATGAPHHVYAKLRAPAHISLT